MTSGSVLQYSTPPIHTWSDCDPQLAPKQGFLIEKLIPEKGGNLLIAAPKAGKSQLAAHLTACLVTGKPVFGHYQVHATEAIPRILAILTEENRFRFRERVEANLRGLGLTDKEIEELNTKLDDIIVVSARTRDSSLPVSDMVFSIERHADWVLDQLQAGTIDLVILDSLRPAHSLEENSSTEMKPVTDFIRQIAEHGCGLILHHTGHRDPDSRRFGGDAGRGTSDLDAARDTAIEIQSGRFGGNMSIGFFHRNDPEFWVAVRTEIEDDGRVVRWIRLDATEDPKRATYLLGEATLFQLIDAAAQPKELPKLSDCKRLLGNGYRITVGNLELEGLIESRALQTGRPGSPPTYLMRPGQFSDSEWEAAAGTAGGRRGAR